MSLMLLIGGARSGKSELAVRLARHQTAPVTVIATGEAGDEEMTARIAQHRRDRPTEWVTIEEPLDLVKALAQVPGGDCLIVDCLTLWTANMLGAAGAAQAEARAARAAAIAAGRPGRTIVVTNEVGLGLVPDHPLGRDYRDLLGRVNAIWAGAAERAYLLVAGRALRLEPLPELAP